MKEVKSNGFVYESYDIPKLLTKLYYKNKLPKQLRPLNKIFEEATAPVVINSTYPVIDKVENQEKLAVQPISTNKNGIYIERRRLYIFSHRTFKIVGQSAFLGEKVVFNIVFQHSQ